MTTTNTLPGSAKYTMTLAPMPCHTHGCTQYSYTRNTASGYFFCRLCWRREDIVLYAERCHLIKSVMFGDKDAKVAMQSMIDFALTAPLDEISAFLVALGDEVRR